MGLKVNSGRNTDLKLRVVSRRHHLRTEPDIDIGLSALFNSTRHKARTLPKPTLSALLRNNGVGVQEVLNWLRFRSCVDVRGVVSCL